MVKVKVGVCQCACQEFDFEKTLSHLEKYCHQASLEGVELALFPEGFFGGYPRFSHFGSLIGCRSDEGREEFLRYYNGAISISNGNDKSVEIKKIENISRNENIFLVIGIIEKDGGTLYCSVIFIDPLKGFIHSRRKLMPTGIERLIWGQGNIKDVKSIQFNNDIAISAVICWENYMPLLRYFIYSQNIQIYLAPTADGRDTWIPTMQHIAIEGRTFVLSANQFVKTINMPKEHPLPEQYSNPESILTNGGSVIIDPFGKIIAGPLYNQEGIITANIDTDLCIKGKMDFDVCGHYSRNDIFKLIINNQN